MEKKRRENYNWKKTDIMYSEADFYEHVTMLTDSTLDEGVLYREHIILPEFGEGTIVNLLVEDIEIIVSRYLLKNDLVVTNIVEKDIVQLSFLIDGEKIISIEGTNEEIVYESQESYLATLNSFKGRTRVFGNKVLKEVKIKLKKSFMLNHGFNTNFTLNHKPCQDLIIPINDELLVILNNLQDAFFKGVTRKLYLKAKVLELLANQIENYNNFNIKNKQVVNQDNIIKKLYLIRQLIAENLDQNLTLVNLSRELMLNEFEIKTEFKRIFGLSIHEYAINEKMRKAKDLLNTTQLPIYSIAEKIGYKNATHFSAAFKRSFGITPKKFRNLI
ncbi:helix-turn-helix domain-containing protein [Urechidicola croceus]|uniref:HTH araC/xylS-type domain-containing protein n=1 Tax=Urechidicola croceus TaxID=1850246 RepID=A0A1D8PB09_9FLAO|nr:AraC family transcriptional regulator [Urechidicola croceus]AOW21758.1 hypothetical protein LPB138_14195 [Urechidicola croceus]